MPGHARREQHDARAPGRPRRRCARSGRSRGPRRQRARAGARAIRSQTRAWMRASRRSSGSSGARLDHAAVERGERAPAREHHAVAGVGGAGIDAEDDHHRRILRAGADAFRDPSRAVERQRVPRQVNQREHALEQEPRPERGLPDAAELLRVAPPCGCSPGRPRPASRAATSAPPRRVRSAGSPSPPRDLRDAARLPRSRCFQRAIRRRHDRLVLARDHEVHGAGDDPEAARARRPQPASSH